MNSSLNHIYRVVWNASLGLWQVASEVARNSGKTQSEQRKTRCLKVGAAAVAGALASLSIPSVAFAQLPTGGQVVGGQASIVQNGNALNLNQTTDRAAIDCVAAAFAIQGAELAVIVVVDLTALLEVQGEIVIFMGGQGQACADRMVAAFHRRGSALADGAVIVEAQI